MDVIVKRVSFNNAVNADDFLKKHPGTQLVCPESVFSRKHVIICVEQALKAFRHGNNIARIPEVEFLVRLSGERQIKNALEKTHFNKEAVFVCWGEDSFPDLKEEFPLEEKELEEREDKDAIERSATFWL